MYYRKINPYTIKRTKNNTHSIPKFYPPTKKHSLRKYNNYCILSLTFLQNNSFTLMQLIKSLNDLYNF